MKDLIHTRRVRLTKRENNLTLWIWLFRRYTLCVNIEFTDLRRESC